jgi:AcrR family transcriptional regulator
VRDLSSGGDGSRVNSRAALIEAALAEFTDRGFEAATVAGIAARAGVTTGALYAHFEGKLDLLLACLGLRTIDEVLEVAASATHRPWDEVSTLLGEDLARRPEPQTLLLLDVIVLARRDPAVAETLRAGLGQYLDAIAGAAEVGRKMGLLDPALESGDLARVMAVVTFGLLVLGALDEPPPSEAAFVRLTNALLQSDGPPGDAPTILARVGAKAAAAEQARHDLRAAVAAATAAGHSLRQVGEAAGLSHEGVRRIVAQHTEAAAESAAEDRQQM